MSDYETRGPRGKSRQVTGIISRRTCTAAGNGGRHTDLRQQDRDFLASAEDIAAYKKAMKTRRMEAGN